jgi:galactokinase
LVNVDALVGAYRKRFAGAQPSHIVRSPGRVNLIGEHVDYNGGLVLPLAIEQATYVVAGRGKGECIRAFSATIDGATRIDAGHLTPSDATGWDAYIRGVAAGLLACGVPGIGAQLYIDSDLPIGAGLSSSAALEVGVALALTALSGVTFSKLETARICQRAEQEFVGVPCGIMDQLVCASAVAGEVSLIDCRDLHTKLIPWPDDDVVVLIADSKHRRKLSAGMYAQRVSECRLAVDYLRESDPTVQSLRDVTMDQFIKRRSSMKNHIARRAEHVISEITRTREAAEALIRGDFDRLGAAMNESHASLRDLYEVSSPELDDLAQVIRETPRVFGARLTGAGFGGCVVAVARRETATEVETAMRNRYDSRYGVTTSLTITRPCQGASVTVPSKP